MLFLSTSSIAQNCAPTDPGCYDDGEVTTIGTRDPWVIIFYHNPFGSTDFIPGDDGGWFGGGGGSSAVIPNHSDSDHEFDCNSGGGLSNRIANANAAFIADRTAMGIGYGEFLRRFPTGSYYPYGGAHYEVLDPRGSVPSLAEDEGCN